MALGLTGTACLLNLPIPLLVQGLVDRVVSEGRLSSLPAYALALFAVFAAQAGFAHALSFPYFLRKVRATSVIIRTKMDALFGHLKQKIDGALVIRAYAREPAEEEDFAGRLADVHVPRVLESRFSAALSITSTAISG